METNIFLALGAATILGALVGLEREMSENSNGSVSHETHF